MCAYLVLEMKLGSRFSTSEFHSSLFLLIFLLNLKLGYLQPDAIECDWSVQRLSCPPYATTDWECLQAQLNCTNDKEYHCLRDESGEWTEICAKPITCSKGKEPVLKNSQIVCSNCKHPERYEPVDGTESYKYSECRRIKTSCRRDVSYECAVDKAVRHAQNRQCRCDNEKDYMPQNYDLNSDTWICKEPNDLNCIHAPCPEDVYGNAQTRGSDYRCFVDPNRPSTSGPSQRPSDRSSTVAVTESHATRSSHNGDTEADPVTSPKLVIILVFVSLVALLGLSIAIVLCKLMKCYLWCRKNKYAMPEGPLEVTEIHYRQMSLSWKPPKILPTETHREPLVIHYVITQVQGNTREWAEVTTTKETSCKVIDLEPGTFYNFRVRAKYETGISSPLTTQRMYQTKCLTVPGKPQGLMFCQITTSYITLAWEPPAEDGGTQVTGYVVTYCNTSDNIWTKGQVLEDDVRMWKQENLLKGKEYMFQVTARNKVGESDPLESENSVMLLREPSKPEDLSVNDIMCNEVTLSWNAPKDDGGTNLLHYHIRQKQEGSVWENILKIRSGVLSIKVKKLKPDHTYYFGVCAENKVGEGEFCDTVKPTQMPKRLGPPDSPSGPLECLNVDYTELILSWKPPQYDGGFPLTGYKVQTKESWVYYTTETTVSSNTTMYQVKNLKDGSNYRFKVYAVNEKGLSDVALESTEIVTKTILPPDMPAGCLKVSDISDTEVTLVWNHPEHNGGSPVTNFSIGKREDKFVSSWNDETVALETTKYKFSGLKAGTAYKFRIRAQNIKHISSPVEISCTTTKVTGPPGIPEGHIEAVDITNDALTLVWKKPLDDGGFPIERYRIETKGLTGWTRFYQNNPEETQYSFSKLKEGINYQFRVRAVNKKGAGEFVEKVVTTRTAKDRPSKPSADSEKNVVDSSSQAIHSTSQASEVPDYTSPNSKASKDEDSASVERKGASQTLQTSDRPVAPFGPLEVKDVDANSLTLSWRPPDHTGNDPITGYIIELMMSVSWIFAKRIPPDTTTCHLNNLLEGAKYHFRVSAENKIGISDPLTTTDRIETRKLKAPPPPKGPISYSNVMENSVRLSWQPPDDIGKSQVTGYTIACKEKSEKRWRDGVFISQSLTFTQENLLLDHMYMFSITAKNAKGNSEPLISEEPVQLERLLRKPSAPAGPLNVVVVEDSKSVELSWQLPETDESSLVDEYKIEYRELSESDWIQTLVVGNTDNSVIWTVPKEEIQYEFQVTAVTCYGVASDPLRSKEPVKILAPKKGSKGKR